MRSCEAANPGGALPWANVASINLSRESAKRLSQSLVKNLIHLVYSTKHRRPWIQAVHHGRIRFQDELRKLLSKQGVDFDER